MKLNERERARARARTGNRCLQDSLAEKDNRTRLVLHIHLILVHYREMGNVPISCCRSKSPRPNEHDSRNRDAQQVSHKTNQAARDSARQDRYTTSQPSHILQHISEREPDDVETDPSSNPYNRPIFATRSTGVVCSQPRLSSSLSTTSNSIRIINQNYVDNSYSGSSTTDGSVRKQQANSVLMASQDQGYNSANSTNLASYNSDANAILLNDSFVTNAQTAIFPNSATNTTNNSEQTHVFEQKDVNHLELSHSPTTHTDEVAKERRPTIGYVVQIDSTHHADSKHISNQNHCRLTKSSSCSTIFTDGSTISQPDLTQTIKCVSLAIYYHIENRTSDYAAEIFDETVYPLRMPCTNEAEDGSHEQSKEVLFADETIACNRTGDKAMDDVGLTDEQKTIYRFVDTLFKAAQLTSEYAITTLVYLERLTTYAEMDLTPTTWRRMFLGAIVLSSKVWEDQAVWNVDYAQILEDISVEDINELERQFLEFIQFNMNVPSSVYAKYYFHLRTLAIKNGFSKDCHQLTVDEAKSLEVSHRHKPPIVAHVQ